MERRSVCTAGKWPIRRFACRTGGILSKLPDRAGLNATRSARASNVTSVMHVMGPRDDATDSLVLNFGLAPPSDPRAPQID